MEIKVRYSSVDSWTKTSTFKTIAGARKFAAKWVGESPEIGVSFGYAVSADGVGKVQVWGDATVLDLFPPAPAAAAQAARECSECSDGSCYNCYVDAHPEEDSTMYDPEFGPDRDYSDLSPVDAHWAQMEEDYMNGERYMLAW